MMGEGPWRKVSVSLSWLFWLTLVKVVAIAGVALVAAALMNSVTTIEEVESALSVLSTVMVGAFVVEVFVIVALAGYANVPEHSGARGGAIAAVTLAVVVLGMDVLTSVPIFTRDYEAMAEGSAWDTLGSLGKIAFIFVQLSSFRSLATHLGAPELERTTSTCMLLIGVLIGLAFIGGILAAAAGSEVVGLIVVVGVAGLGIWALVLYLIIMHRLARRARDEGGVASAFV